MAVAPASVVAGDEDPAAATSAPDLDPALVELNGHLESLDAGALSDSISVKSLFGVDLDDSAAVAKRVTSLAGEIAESKSILADLDAQLASVSQERARAEEEEEAEQATDEPPIGAPVASETSSAPSPRDEPGPALEPRPVDTAAFDLREQDLRRRAASTRLLLEIQRARRAYLERLQARRASLTDVGRRSLAGLSAPRGSLRSRAAEMDRLARVLEELANQYGVLSERVSTGAVVGFVSQRRALAQDLATAASSLRSQSRRLDERAEQTRSLAKGFEAEATSLRAAFYRSIPSDASKSAFDELFRVHVERQRMLRQRGGDSVAVSGTERFLEAEAQTQAQLARMGTIGTADDALGLLEAGLEHREAVEVLIASESAGQTAWHLAFENEVVSLLSDLATEAARRDAYALSTEILSDVAGEFRIAWSRIREGARERREEIPSWTALVMTSSGQSILLRLAGILAAIALWRVLKRKTPRITVSLVKGLSRLRPLRGRVRSLVRWSGLVQAVLPVAFAWLTLSVVVQLIGPESLVGAVLMVVGVPSLAYLTGRQILLGTTQRLTSGRPPLIEITPSTLERLTQTYASLGVALAVAYAIDGLAKTVIGVGRVVTLIEGVLLLWIAVWSILEAVRWRPFLAERWAQVAPRGEQPGIEQRVAEWMKNHSVGFVLSPLVLLRLAVFPVAVKLARLATETGALQSLRAQILRRRSRRALQGAQSGGGQVPEAYSDAFPLYPTLGDDDSLLVPRDDVVAGILEQHGRWMEQRIDGSVVLVGEKGIGKTTLASLLARKLGDHEVVECTLRGKPTTKDALLGSLAHSFELPVGVDRNDLEGQLCNGPERVVILDEAHNVFLREIDGFGAYEALIEIVNATAQRVFWVIIFNSFTWRFLSESRGRAPYFRKIVHLPRWTPEEIQRLIRLRHNRTGFELRFDPILLSDDHAENDDLHLIDEDEGYFRLLWETSEGNPRIATQLWLSSLAPVDEQTLSVGIFREPSSGEFSHLQDDLVFALASICQHENLDVAELARTLNMPESAARFAIQYLSERGIIEPKREVELRYTLSPGHYRRVLKMLRSKHLLYEA